MSNSEGPGLWLRTDDATVHGVSSYHRAQKIPLISNCYQYEPLICSTRICLIGEETIIMAINRKFDQRSFVRSIRESRPQAVDYLVGKNGILHN